MKITCLSDTHLRTDIVIPEDADMIIHAGDAMLKGSFADLCDFTEWFSTLKARYKVFVAGNHDRIFQDNPEVARGKLPEGTIYLQDSMVEIEGLKIYGSPWQPEFQEWAFNLPRGEALREKWAQIPDGIDILITHGPPQGVLDYSKFGREHVGCAALRTTVEHRVKPRLHVFGHIHGDYGQVRLGGTLFVNAAICDEAYRPTHGPIVVEILPGKPVKVLVDKKRVIPPQKSAGRIVLPGDQLW